MIKFSSNLTAKLVDAAKKSRVKVLFEDSVMGSHYNPLKKAITIVKDQIIPGGGKLDPTKILAHELGHARTKGQASDKILGSYMQAVYRGAPSEKDFRRVLKNEITANRKGVSALRRVGANKEEMTSFLDHQKKAIKTYRPLVDLVTAKDLSSKAKGIYADRIGGYAKNEKFMDYLVEKNPARVGPVFKSVRKNLEKTVPGYKKTYQAIHSRNKDVLNKVALKFINN